MAESRKPFFAANTRKVVPLTDGQMVMAGDALVWIQTPAEHSRLTMTHLQCLAQYTVNLEARLAAYEPVMLAMAGG